MVNYRPDILPKLFVSSEQPGGTLEEMFLGSIFGLNPLYWQILGLILKILASLSVSLMILGVTRSYRIAALAGLFFSTNASGIESFTWANTQVKAFNIIFFDIGFYYWVKSFEENNLRGLIYSLPFLLVSILISPGRAVSLPVLVLIWDVLSLIKTPSKNKAKLAVIRITNTPKATKTSIRIKARFLDILF